ncbi:hypothetical protein GCM10009863_67710 [Streptomyces axinellae]|uniref:BioF2-like acetyltransferase domain-containing protein n=1 Tax=Streptomyces axinellae TaxID=552788 RepID=A0ABN3R1E8_9ACTN
MWVGSVAHIDPRQERHWRELYERCGERVEQSPEWARAVGAAGREVCVALGARSVLPFEHGARVCTALGTDRPLLTADPGAAALVEPVAAAAAATGKPVYLPLVEAAFAEVRALAPFTVWERPANSLIDWACDGADLWERVLDRGTSQLRRKRRLVERDGLQLDPGLAGADAAEDVLRVDDRSWKATCGQNMRTRGQDRLYRRLVTVGTLTAAFLRDGDRPVAFRLDARVKDLLSCLKWSYDEDYRRYSPGLYLLTEGLRREWSGRGVRVVDLHGGPDTLKDLLYSERRPRVDLWYGDAEKGARQAAERAAFDARVAAVREGGKGLRHAFG